MCCVEKNQPPMLWFKYGFGLRRDLRVRAVRTEAKLTFGEVERLSSGIVLGRDAVEPEIFGQKRWICGLILRKTHFSECLYFAYWRFKRDYIVAVVACGMT